ncbi:MAG TPA: extradiol ring-cleavage dioxygenase, partial [Methylomirabilota bacterium]|nr:extradiol ring-cleavage dioxygenase [Methylomirabilota bacterium]
MGQIIAAMASSHAYTFLEPKTWDKRREFTRSNYKKRFGVEPPDQPQVQEETLESNEARYTRIRDGLTFLRDKILALRPDMLIVVGDDQNENFLENNLPQFSIYLGKKLIAADRNGRTGQTYRCDSDAAWTMLEQCVESGIDLAYSTEFPNNHLISHAHREPLEYLQVNGDLSIVPIFINAIHVPAPTPARCYQFGETLKKVIESLPAEKRVMIYASGGLSHFSAGYPWPHYKGPCTLGSICHDFDRKLVEWMQNGKGRELAALSNKDLIQNGEIELRQWITLMGIIGNGKPELLVYEPFYRGLLGMAVGYWNLAS